MPENKPEYARFSKAEIAWLEENILLPTMEVTTKSVPHMVDCPEKWVGHPSLSQGEVAATLVMRLLATACWGTRDE